MGVTKSGSASFEDDDTSGLDDLAEEIQKEKAAAKAKAIQQAAADEAVAAQQASVLAAQKAKIDRQNQAAADEAAAAQQVAVEKAAAVVAAQKAEDARTGAAAQEAAQAAAAEAAAQAAAAQAAAAAYAASVAATASTSGGGYDYVAPVRDRDQSSTTSVTSGVGVPTGVSPGGGGSRRPSAKKKTSYGQSPGAMGGKISGGSGRAEGGLIQKPTKTKKSTTPKTKKRGLAARK